MKLCEMTLDMLRACSLKCPLKLKQHADGTPASSGDWWVMPAKNEAVWKYTKLAKKDLFDRELRGASYKGDFGHVTIGSHKFTFYPFGSVLVRDDFGTWVENNWHKALKEDGTERESNRPTHAAEVEVIPVARQALTAKYRVGELSEPTDLIHADAWNTLYDMKLRFQRYLAEQKRDNAHGEFYVVSLIQSDLLAAMISHRERNYPEAIDRFVWIAAAALKAADYEARMHEKKEAK